MSDFLNMLKEHNINLDDLNNYINSKEFELKAGPVVDDKNKNYTVKESAIEGVGIFAERQIIKGEQIGYGIINNTRTLAGRYVNHSAVPNAKFYFFRNNDNMILIADKIINEGEEIVTNYRHHTYKKEYYE
tara:strand:+ start:5441 stop:5833 length:393 start_codon:yes stop_codon:yes gene_type:complete